jgi:hypothetical protein
MDFEITFPLRYWINLARRSDRRGETEWRLAEAGITAERFPAVDARFVSKMALERKKSSSLATDESHSTPSVSKSFCDAPSLVRGYESAGRYALALAQRLAIRQAKLRGAASVLLFEDDVVLHPNFHALIEEIDLPEDWGIFFFGCQHTMDPIPCAPGIVRVRHAFDTHGFAIRKPYYDRVIQALDAHGKPTPRHPLASDRFLAALESEIPTYACFPNLAWQLNDQSDLVHISYSNYHSGGTQKQMPGLVERTFATMAGVEIVEPGTMDPKLGLLFLTRGDVNHPVLWREFVDGQPDRVRVLSHPKFPDAIEGGFLAGTAIEDNFETEWGKVSLVSATLALLRAALEDETLTHFVLLSESCVPIRPLVEMLRRLRINPSSRFGWKALDECWEFQKARAAHLPQIPAGCWRFQSQWWLLDRMAATWVARADFTDVFAGMPVPDEAYFATVLTLLGYPIEDRVVKKEITWAQWEAGTPSPKSHLVVDTFTAQAMAESSAWFARKFPAESDIARWGLHKLDANQGVPVNHQ